MGTREYTLKIRIEGAASAAAEALNASLGAGDLQSAINAYEHDEGPVRVTSALVATIEEVEEDEDENEDENDGHRDEAVTPTKPPVIKVLVYQRTGKLVQLGDQAENGGDEMTVTGWRDPQREGSSGRVWVTMGGHLSEFFPSVIGATFMPRALFEAGLRPCPDHQGAACEHCDGEGYRAAPDTAVCPAPARPNDGGTMITTKNQAAHDLDLPADVADTVAAHAAVLRCLRLHKATYTGGCPAFYSQAQWAARGESYGHNAVLIICHDGGALPPFFADNYNDRRAYEAMAAELDKAGFWVEQCTATFSAVYKRS